MCGFEPPVARERSLATLFLEDELRNIFIGLIVIAFWSGHAFAGTENYPMTLLAPLDFTEKTLHGPISPSVAATLYGLPVSTKEHEDRSVILTNPKKETEKSTVTTCREYQKLKNDGWIEASTVDMMDGSFFNDTCGILSIAVNSAPSKQSNFKKIPDNAKDLENLPGEMLDVMYFGESGGHICDDLKSLKACADERHAKVKFKNGKIEYSDSRYEAAFTPAFKADLNKDGYEDMVYIYGYSLTEGTMHGYGHICLENTKSKKPASVIDCGLKE